MFIPSRFIIPPSTFVDPAIMFKSVLLPHPLGPIIAVHLFSSISRLKPSKIIISFSVFLLKLFCKLLIVKMALHPFIFFIHKFW